MSTYTMNTSGVVWAGQLPTQHIVLSLLGTMTSSGVAATLAHTMGMKILALIGAVHARATSDVYRLSDKITKYAQMLTTGNRLAPRGIVSKRLIRHMTAVLRFFGLLTPHSHTGIPHASFSRAIVKIFKSVSGRIR
jgi:hypothetical protein